MSRNVTDWRALNQEILGHLDLKAEFESLGVEITGTNSGGDGWQACWAVDRAHGNSPSAAVNVHTGRYRDLGGEGLHLGLFDLAAHLGRHATWQEARAAYASKAGVKLPKSKPPADPAEHLKFKPWNEGLANLFCLRKRGVTPESIQANGGRMALYRNQHNVIAMPIFGAGLVHDDPCGWVIWNVDGGKIPVFRPGQPPQWVKMKTTAGSAGGLMGRYALERAADRQGDLEVQVIKTEGPSDLLTLFAAIPTDFRDRTLVVCNAGGTNETPKPEMLGPFVGRRVAVIHDADVPGRAGADRWTAWLAGSAHEVRNVALPYEVTPDHGRDLRDYLASHTWPDLAALIASTTPAPKPAGAGDAQPLESDDDPHRLARVFLSSNEDHPIRYWRQEFYRWTDSAYSKLEDEEVRSRVVASVKKEFDRINLAAQESPQGAEQTPRTQRVTRQIVGNVEAALKSLAIIPGTVAPPAWIGTKSSSRSNHCISLQNGVVDLDALLSAKEQFLFPRTPDFFTRSSMPFSFDQNANYPTFKRVITENLEADQERLRLIQEWTGYLLTPDARFQKFLVMEGEGANGKSVYCAVVEALLGSANVSHVPLELFSQRFALTPTLGCLANLSAECGELDKVGEGFLKSFVAGDRMMFDRKGKAPIEATPTARLMLATNNRPRFSDRSQGLWRRMIVMPFRVQVPELKRVLGMDQVEWWIRSGELPGIFNWALAGLTRLYANAGFTRSTVCEAAVDDYRLETNPARSFLLSHCEESNLSLAGVGCSELYEIYKKWCHTNSYMPLGEKIFGKEVKRAFPDTTRHKLGSRGDRFYVYRGISVPEGF